MAPKILRITIEQPSRLLRLPRELRDVIYEYALTEPKRWDKRHVHGCPYYNYTGLGETPPWRVAGYGYHFPEAFYTSSEDRIDRASICREKCLKRRGLGLLTVNKQVHSEASSIFWKVNTFCFDDFDIFATTFSSLSPLVLSQIRSLSLIKAPELPLWPGSVPLTLTGMLYPTTAEVREILDKMPRLIRLELSLEWVGLLENRFTGFRSLRFPDCVVMKRLTYEIDGGIREDIDVGLKSQISVPRCLPGSSSYSGRCGGKPGATYCRFCDEFFMATVQELYALDLAQSHNSRPWSDEVRRKIEVKQPAHRASYEPYILPLKMLDGTQKEVNVWGLPTLTVEEYIRYRRQVARDAYKANRATIMKQRASPQRMLIDDDEGNISVPRGRSGKHWKRLEEQRALEHTKATQRKEDARMVEIRDERAKKKTAKKNASRERQEAISEAQAERKAARKRSGRRLNVKKS